MGKVTGPTIPRWQLGKELTKLRLDRGMTLEDIRTTLDCSESKARNIELGRVGIDKTDLAALLDLYAVDESQREPLTDLQQQGRQRGWWSKYGALPWTYATLLGLEEGAKTIKTYEPMLVPGLLQTDDYARAVVKALVPDIEADAAETQVQIRQDRQRRTLSDDPPTIRVILEEAALRKVVGGADVTRAQLTHLLKASEWMRLQILPASKPSPGLDGPFTILEFDEDLHSPIVSTSGQGGNLYMEKEPEVARCNLAYEHMTAIALAPDESRRLIADVRQGVDDAQ